MKKNTKTPIPRTLKTLKTSQFVTRFFHSVLGMDSTNLVSPTRAYQNVVFKS